MELNRDDRKSAKLVARNARAEPGVELIGDFGFAREILRHVKIKQDGAGAEQVDVGNPEHVPVFFLDGELHHKRRAAIVKFFTPKAIQTRYLGVMERTTDKLVAQFRASGRARLDEISFELAVAVASEIVGLTASDRRKMSHRLATLLASTFSNAAGIRRLINKFNEVFYGTQFMFLDVMPAVRERRKERRDDIISQTLDKNYSDRAIMIECMTYATAGMVTTRELIVMAAWHLFDRPDIRERFVASDEDGQMAILMEILRLEPIAAMIYRRADEDIQTNARGTVRARSKYAVDLRGVNSDEAAVGPCPYAFDPDRAQKLNQNGTFMSFGDGSHRCPGWQVALSETRVFLDRLMRVPGIRLERAPDMHWNAPLMSYELRDAVITCDRA
ncbi:MAG TPA: cytochrome P450 [Polyangiales bacterium]|nr:cytochrome P450 [Polyangiales bacterium]